MKIFNSSGKRFFSQATNLNNSHSTNKFLYAGIGVSCALSGFTLYQQYQMNLIYLEDRKVNAKLLSQTVDYLEPTNIFSELWNRIYHMKGNDMDMWFEKIFTPWFEKDFKNWFEKDFKNWFENILEPWLKNIGIPFVQKEIIEFGKQYQKEIEKNILVKENESKQRIDDYVKKIEKEASFIQSRDLIIMRNQSEDLDSCLRWMWGSFLLNIVFIIKFFFFKS
jgi:hypothetical protein